MEIQTDFKALEKKLDLDILLCAIYTRKNILRSNLLMGYGLLFHSLLFCSLSLWVWIISLTFLLMGLLYYISYTCVICITLGLASLALSFDFFLLVF